jgi:hypothetical protein
MSDGELTTPPEPVPVVPTEPTPKKKRHREPRRPLKQVLRLMLARLYTFALFAGIAAICAVALAYLFRSVFTPPGLPESLARWQGSIDAAALRQPHVPGVTDGAGRAPVSHYHKVDRWFQADPHNGCTVVGCHEPLPHTVKSKVAAFANMHVTFMDCRVCHEATDAGTTVVEAHWVNTASDRPQDPPAALRLVKMLEANGLTKENARQLNPQIVSLLKETLAEVGHNETIEDLMVQIDSSVPGSPIWLRSVWRLKSEIPLHARGEYGARLARQSPAWDALHMAPRTKAYLGQTSEGAARKGVSDEIHRTVLAKPNACQSCHSKEKGMLDFEALGYSPKRASALRTLPLAGLMEQIRHGETFQLPRLLEANDGR